MIRAARVLLLVVLTLSPFALSLAVAADKAAAPAAPAGKAAAPAGGSVSAATTELMRSVMPPDAYDAMLDQFYKQMAAGMQQMGNKSLTPDKQKALKEAVKETMPYEDLLTWTGEIYTKHFTKQEIDDLVAFYKTPTGKKMARILPTISGEMGAKLAPIVLGRLPAALKKRGIQ